MYSLLVLFRLKASKKKLMYIWDSKGVTDREVLEAAEEVDKWLNEYDRLPKNSLILGFKC
jgi:hypothetical protein